MRRFIYWLMGDRAGRVVVSTWRWLWGLPIESGGKIAVAVAAESLQTMQESVQKLARAVALQVGAYERASLKYQEKIREYRTLEQQAQLAQRSGQQDAARLAMSRAIQIEKLLPTLEDQVQQAAAFVESSKEKLTRERMKLEQYKSDMENIKDLAEVNAALESIAQVNNEFDVDSARSTFAAAKAAVEGRHLTSSALASLSENPQEKLEADLEKLTLDEQVNLRLRAMEQPLPISLPEPQQP